MLTLENEYFIRLLLLILKGGTSVLRKVFRKQLEDSGLQLADFLHCNKEQIDKLKEDKILTLKQYNILFPSNGNITDLRNYDISLLSCLLLNIFHRAFKQSELRAIEKIRTFRNDFLAHFPNDSIDGRTFLQKWNQLQQLINNLGHGLSVRERSDLANVIKFVAEDPIDIKQTIQDIKDTTSTTDQFMEHVSQQIENMSLSVQDIKMRQEDTITELRKLQNDYENRILYGEVIISSKNPEAAIKAASILFEYAKQATSTVKRKTSMKNDGRKGVISFMFSLLVRLMSYFWSPAADTTNAEEIDNDSSSHKSVTALVQDIHNAGGKIVDVTKGSVLLHIQCHSALVVLDVLNYFQSSEIEQRLNDIATCLTEEVGSCIHLSAYIQEESLRKTLFYLQQDEHQEYTKKVCFSINCQNADDILNVVRLMEGRKLTNTMSELAKELSGEVGCSVTLRSTVNMDLPQQFIIEKGADSEDKEETNISEDRSDVSTSDDEGFDTKEKGAEMCRDARRGVDDDQSKSLTVENHRSDVSIAEDEGIQTVKEKDTEMPNFIRCALNRTVKEDISDVSTTGEEGNQTITIKTKMLTVENEYFIRLLLLIFKGGTSVLRQVFRKKLEDSGLQLSAFLNVNRKQIHKLKEDKVLNLKQYNVLFPSNGMKTDSENYDISLLSCLLLNIFSRVLEKSEIKAIENIRTLRNDLQAHHPNDSIDVRTFFRKWNQLRTSIDNLRNGLTREQSENLSEVVRSAGDDPIDIKRAIQDINDATSTTDQFMEHVSQQLDSLSLLVQQIGMRQDTCTKVEELKQKFENRNESMPPLIVIIGKITISSEDPKAALAAADILTDDTKKCACSFKYTSSITDDDRKRDTNPISSVDMTRVDGATNAELEYGDIVATALVKDINDAGGCIVDVTKGSVLLHIQCHSINAVSHVVNYFQSSKIAQRLNDIAKYLTEQVGSDVHLSANIQDESLQEARRYLKQEEHQLYTKEVHLAIKCRNADGVFNVVELIEGREMTSKMSAISNVLSNKVGRSVILRSSVDKSPLQQYIVDKRGDNEDKEKNEKGGKCQAKLRDTK